MIDPYVIFVGNDHIILDPLIYIVFVMMFFRMAADSLKVYYIVKKDYMRIFLGSIFYNGIWIATLWITFSNILTYSIPAVLGGGIGSVAGLQFRQWLKKRKKLNES